MSLLLIINCARIAAMKYRIATLILLLLLFAVPSCTQVHTRFIDLGQRFDGVQPDKVCLFKSGGKLWVKGQRMQFSLRRQLFVLEKHGRYEYIPIDGTQGEIVYREVCWKSDARPPRYDYAEGSKWRSLPADTMQQVKVHADDELWFKANRTGKFEADAHALWAYPMAVASFVAVDVPSVVLAPALWVLLVPPLYCVDAITQQQHADAPAN